MGGLIELDGSQGEGGGAMLRVALGMGEATGKAFRMKNIRAGRPQPGLKQQHLVGIRALQELTGAKVNDARIGSEEILYVPGGKPKMSIEINAETAAPASLILQSIIPTIVAHGKKCIITMTAGTDVAWSPQIDYFANVFAPNISSLATITMKMTKRGYFPKGQGQLVVTVAPKREKKPLQLLERGPLLRFGGKSHAAFALELNRVASRQMQAARIYLENNYTEHYGNYLIDLFSEYHDTESIGSGVTVWAEFKHSRLGADKLGERDLLAEKVGEAAAKQLLDFVEQDGVVDSWMGDQLIPYLALYGGEFTTTEITAHTKANIAVCEAFMEERFTMAGNRITLKK